MVMSVTFFEVVIVQSFFVGGGLMPMVPSLTAVVRVMAAGQNLLVNRAASELLGARDGGLGEGRLPRHYSSISTRVGDARAILRGDALERDGALRADLGLDLAGGEPPDELLNGGLNLLLALGDGLIR